MRSSRQWIVLVALVVSWGWILARPARAQAPAQKKPTVAVLYFDYDGKSEEMGFLRKGLAQMLVTDLADLPEVEIVERVRLEDALAELELNSTNKIDKSTANRIGKLLGARYLVMGGYFDISGTMRVDARVVEVETGKVVASMGKHRKADEFLELEQYLAAELQKVLRGLETKPAQGQGQGKTRSTRRVKQQKQLQQKQPQPRRPKQPESLEARQAAAYGKALDAMDRGDTRSAQNILQTLVKERPDFEMASLDLAALAK